MKRGYKINPLCPKCGKRMKKDDVFYYCPSMTPVERGKRMSLLFKLPMLERSKK